jgi:hypothetical protein
MPATMLHMVQLARMVMVVSQTQRYKREIMLMSTA